MTDAQQVKVDIPEGTMFVISVDMKGYSTVIAALDELPGKHSRRLANDVEQQMNNQVKEHIPKAPVRKPPPQKKVAVE